MINMLLRRVVILPLLLIAPSLALAQASTQQTATHLDAAQFYATSNSSAATITLTPAASQSVYISAVKISNCAGASAVTAAAETSVTTTNLGSPTSLSYQIGSGTTAGACAQEFTDFWPNGLKATTPGTAVTFVLPTFATNQTVRVGVSWYSAP